MIDLREYCDLYKWLSQYTLENPARIEGCFREAFADCDSLVDHYIPVHPFNSRMMADKELPVIFLQRHPVTNADNDQWYKLHLTLKSRHIIKVQTRLLSDKTNSAIDHIYFDYTVPVDGTFKAYTRSLGQQFPLPAGSSLIMTPEQETYAILADDKVIIGAPALAEVLAPIVSAYANAFVWHCSDRIKRWGHTK